MKSPLRYAGGKQKAAPTIFKYFPPSPARYIEPMVGGGSLFFYAQEHSYTPQYWINDLNKDLIDFYEAFSKEDYNRRKVHQLQILRGTLIPSEYSDSSMELITDPGVAFFIRNRASFSGTTQAGGWSPYAGQRIKIAKDWYREHPYNRFTESSINRLTKLPEALKDVKITNFSVFQVLKEAKMGDFVYLDPPYVTARRLYGKNGQLHDFDHSSLAAELKNAKYKWLTSYDDCPTIRELYKDFKIVPLELNYSMGKKKKGKELLIMNYEAN